MNKSSCSTKKYAKGGAVAKKPVKKYAVGGYADNNKSGYALQGPTSLSEYETQSVQPTPRVAKKPQPTGSNALGFGSANLMDQKQKAMEQRQRLMEMRRAKAGATVPAVGGMTNAGGVKRQPGGEVISAGVSRGEVRRTMPVKQGVTAMAKGGVVKKGKK